MKTLYVMCGPSGSGKSSYIKNFMLAHADSIVISRDAIRFSLVSEDESYFAKEKQVFNSYVTMAQTAMSIGYNNIFLDATHLTVASRAKILNRLLEYSKDYILQFVFLTTEKERCVTLDKITRSGRERVGADVIENQFNQLQLLTQDEINRYEKHFIEVNIEGVNCFGK